jgi:selenide,water dikinase
MIQLNDIGRDVMLEQGAHAATDITGFGLAGHSREMAEGSGVTLTLSLAQLPIFPGAEAFAKKPYLTRASGSNFRYVAEALDKPTRLDPVRWEFLFDPQTSGGMLMSVPADRAEAVVQAARARGAHATSVIGEVLPRGAKALLIRE